MANKKCVKAKDEIEKEIVRIEGELGHELSFLKEHLTDIDCDEVCSCDSEPPPKTKVAKTKADKKPRKPNWYAQCIKECWDTAKAGGQKPSFAEQSPKCHASCNARKSAAAKTETTYS